MGLPRVIGRHHGDLGAEPAGGRRRFRAAAVPMPPIAGANSLVNRRMFNPAPSIGRRRGGKARAHPEFPDDSGTPARAGCWG